MNLDDLPEEIRLIMCRLLKAAIFNKRNGMTENRFMEFSKGVWETIELNDLDKLDKIIDDYAILSLERHVRKQEN